jgi:probable HAF family extracellular repeat protein
MFRLLRLAVAAVMIIACAARGLMAAQLYQITDLGTLGGALSEALGLNNNGQIVGYSDMPGNAPYHAFLYDNGAMTDLGTLGGVMSAAQGINDAGQIVGYGSLPGETQHACLFWNGTKTDLGLLLPSNSFAHG